MYHIKNDKRAIKSAELVYSGLSDLIEKKSFDSITITDIQKASGVGRATFYRSFDNVNDVLYWQCSLHYQEVMTGYLEERAKINGKEDPYAFMTYFFSYWMKGENSRILEQLIKTGHYDIIYRCHFESTFIIKNSVPPKERFGRKVLHLLHIRSDRCLRRISDHMDREWENAHNSGTDFPAEVGPGRRRLRPFPVIILP
jgi:AcrR family transcriptional regulator